MSVLAPHAKSKAEAFPIRANQALLLKLMLVPEMQLLAVGHKQQRIRGAKVTLTI
jgi:hypothetical protein